MCVFLLPALEIRPHDYFFLRLRGGVDEPDDEEDDELDTKKNMRRDNIKKSRTKLRITAAVITA